MTRGDWRFFATTLHGDGTETLLAADLPITGASITEALSGADSLSGTIEPEWLHIMARDGRPVLTPWQSAIYAELDGALRFGGILRSLKSNGPVLTLDVVGFVGYLEGMPWTNSPYKGYGVDPAHVMRLVWKYAQQHDRGNLGVTVSPDVDTPVKLGRKVTEVAEQPAPTTASKTTTTATATTVTTTTKKTTLERDGNTVVTTVVVKTTVKATKATTTRTTTTTKVTRTDLTVSTTVRVEETGKATATKVTTSKLPAGSKVATAKLNVVEDDPFVLANYATHDLLATFNEVAELGSVDYRERHSWDGDRIRHEITLGYPRIGRRRTDIAFTIGINVDEPECQLDADDYASEVLVVGAGEGDKTVRGWAANPSADRLRRVAVVSRKGIGRVTTAQSTAASLAKAMNSFSQDITTLTVTDHQQAPLGSWEPGDEIYLDGDTGWAGTVGQWVRVLSTTWTPDDSSTATVSVARADKV